MAFPVILPPQLGGDLTAVKLKTGGCEMELGLIKIVGMAIAFGVVVATSIRRTEHGTEDRWAFTLFADEAEGANDFDAEDAILSQAAKV